MMTINNRVKRPGGQLAMSDYHNTITGLRPPASIVTSTAAKAKAIAGPIHTRAAGLARVDQRWKEKSLSPPTGRRGGILSLLQAHPAVPHQGRLRHLADQHSKSSISCSQNRSSI